MENTTIDDVRQSPANATPDLKDSALLVMDASLTLLRLGKSEALQALAALPQLLVLGLYRLPALLLCWLSFGALVASSVHALTGNAVLSALSFFLLQLGLTVVLERRFRRVRQRLAFPETRSGLAAFQAGLHERFGHDGR